jgi:hypothetical protein
VDASARLFLCACCRRQVALCSPCDRGQRYCSRACARQVREACMREAARRYQRGYPGRMAHAARQRRLRERQLHSACEPQAGANKVTHQGCPAPASDAPLLTWTHDHAPSNLSLQAEAAPPMWPPMSLPMWPSMSPPMAAPGEEVAATPQPLQSRSALQWCWRCAAPLSTRLRQGFLRHGARHGERSTQGSPRHDHSP